MRNHGVSFHQYADDTQIYYTFKTSVAGDFELAKLRLKTCINDIDAWMLHNNLKLNDDKTRSYSSMLTIVLLHLWITCK